MADELAEEKDSETEELYEWCAVGESCAVCDALDGMTFTSAPTAVHPHCDCEVRPATGQPPSSYRNCENNWDIRFAHSDWSGGPPANHLTVHVEVEAKCWDGTIITDSVDVDFGDDPDIDLDVFGDQLWFAVAEHVEELVAVNCPACQPTPLS